MDELSAVLEAVRLRGELYCRLEARAPWAMTATPSPSATFHGVVTGRAVLQIAGEPDMPLGAGDLAVLCHGSAHTIGDAPGRAAASIRELIGPRGTSWLVRCGGQGARTTLVCGGFSAARDAPPLLALMPPVMVLRGSERAPDLLRLLAVEAGARNAGAEAMVARLAEALFVEVAREWTARGEGEARRLGALRDPRVAAALTAIHKAPAKAWTVQSLAREAAMSRSAFALAFARLVGMPPLEYVIRWRLYAAKALLRESAQGVAQIAERVGYESEASLGKAFKRRFGVAPGAYRRTAMGRS
jgi:AraC-like DNA-binding protein